MLAALVMSAWLAGGTATVETKFVQVAPGPKKVTEFKRSPGQTRAVVLIHGLRPHPLVENNVLKPDFQSWQDPGSGLVKALEDHFDVFAFAYAQHVGLGEIVAAPGLKEGMGRLKELGYTETVLVGHSAGGLIARHFVEDHPDAGVTKVVQVCSPNGGSSLARVKAGVRRSQQSFVASLTREERERYLKRRNGKKVPPKVEFVCVVGNWVAAGDGLVQCNCQWTEDLQEQGIPAVPLRTSHFLAMRSKENVKALTKVIRDPYPRWSKAQVEVAKPAIFGKPKEKEVQGARP